MPTIKQYENRVNLTERLDPGSAIRAGNAQGEALQNRGQATAQLGKQLGATIEYVGERWEEQRAKEEISLGSRAASELTLGMTRRWNKEVTEGDPNDPQIGQRFRDELEPDLEAWSESFKTKQGKAWAQSQVGAIRNHFVEKTIADQSRLAGVAAVENLRTTVATASNAAQEDPTSTTLQLGLVDSTIEGLAANPNLTPAQVAQIRGELRPTLRKDVLTGAAVGMARADPGKFQEALAAGWGKGELDAGDRDKLWGYAESIKNAKEADARQAAAEQVRVEKRSFENAALQLQPRLSDSGQMVYPQNFATQLEELRRQPGADQDRINSMQQAYQAAIREDITGALVQSNPIIRQSLFARIGSSTQPLSEAEILSARGRSELSNDDTTLLLKAVPGAGGDPAVRQGYARVNQLKTYYKPLVSGSASPLGLTPAGAQRYAEFANRIDLAYQGFLMQGYDANTAIDQIRKDIPTIAGRYAVGGQEAIQSMTGFMNGNGGGLPPVQNPGSPQAGGGSTHTYGNLTAAGGQVRAAGPRMKPGESPEDFLKRTGGE